MNGRLILTKGGRFIVRLHPRTANRVFVRNHFRKWCVRDELVVLTREVFRMAVSPHDYASYGIYFYGDYDPAMTMLLKAYIRESSTCWDVGTERGWFSLLMAKAVGPTGRVDAFEAFPPNFARLCDNLALNGFAWVQAHNVAVSSRSGRMWFVPPSDNVTHNMGYLNDCGGVGYLTQNAQPGAIDVKTTTLDEHASEAGTSSLDFIKIDVEGAEVAALQGARETIRRFRPKMAVEYNRETALRAGTSMEELDELLDSYGYDRFIFSGRLARLHLDDWQGQPDHVTVFNVFCFPRS